MLPLLFSAKGDPWRNVAEHDLEFARGLAREQVRYGPDFDELVKGVIVRCQPIDHRLAGLDASQARQVRLYADHFCMPWAEAWSDALRPCDKERVPSWCDDFQLAGKHLHFGPYFEVLTSELHRSASDLERYDIMAVIAHRLDTKVLRDYPNADIDAWVAGAVSEFLRAASGRDAIAIGQSLSTYSFGRGSAVAKEYQAYSERAAKLTDDERHKLKGLVKALGEAPNG